MPLILCTVHGQNRHQKLVLLFSLSGCVFSALLSPTFPGPVHLGQLYIWYNKSPCSHRHPLCISGRYGSHMDFLPFLQGQTAFSSTSFLAAANLSWGPNSWKVFFQSPSSRYLLLQLLSQQQWIFSRKWEKEGISSPLKWLLLHESSLYLWGELSCVLPFPQSFFVVTRGEQWKRFGHWLLLNLELSTILNWYSGLWWS